MLIGFIIIRKNSPNHTLQNFGVSVERQKLFAAQGTPSNFWKDSTQEKRIYNRVEASQKFGPWSITYAIMHSISTHYDIPAKYSPLALGGGSALSPYIFSQSSFWVLTLWLFDWLGRNGITLSLVHGNDVTIAWSGARNVC